MKPILKRTLLAVTGLILLCMVATGVYFGNFSHADITAQNSLQSTGTVSVLHPDSKTYVFAPENPDAGLIFYPGAKVEYTAYAPLMQALAGQNILCIVVQVPLNFAFFDRNAADGCAARYPEIEHWYVGGHSLGGVVAANYLEDHPDAFDGLLLAASYSNVDLSGLPIQVLSIYGDRDSVLNLEQLENYRAMLPPDTVYSVLEGGNHAQFGSYGPQKHDSEATMPAEEQVRQTAAAFRKVVDAAL